MEYVKGKIQTSMKNSKDKLLKLFKLYLNNFNNKVERYGKPTEVFCIKIIKILNIFSKLFSGIHSYL